MGPPLKAAENDRKLCDERLISAASMGPPLKAAENIRLSGRALHRLPASMGPPLKAAENICECNTMAVLQLLQWGRR